MAKQQSMDHLKLGQFPPLGIYIPSYGRPDRQRTLERLLGVRAGHTYLVVQPQEAQAYAAVAGTHGVQMLVLPEREDGWNLPKTRQWIQENARERYIVQMDDDLDFTYRPWHDQPDNAEGQPTYRLRPCGAGEVGQMLWAIQQLLLSGVVHVGVSPREGNNRVAESHVDNTRMMRLLAQDRELIDKLDLRWDDVDDYEDFNMVLNLLTRGYPNRVLFRYAQGQPGSNTPGGCSIYRTDEFHTHAAQLLQARFPDFVSIVRKPAKNWRGMEERTDVRISWRKAFEYGQRCKNGEVRVLRGPTVKTFVASPLDVASFRKEPVPEPTGSSSAEETSGDLVSVDVRVLMDRYAEEDDWLHTAIELALEIAKHTGANTKALYQAAMSGDRDAFDESLESLEGTLEGSGFVLAYG